MKRLLSLLVALVLFPFSSPASDTHERTGLLKLSIEDLMNVEVTSVSRKAQKATNAPAAVYVITQDDIRRSGATNIPDALRLAPGLDVTRNRASAWTVSARGSVGASGNLLLVLIDGRTIYDPILTGSVQWFWHNIFLEDIDRIEVIRGPGASLWGSNAVNGVINIITKRAKDTEGGLVYAGGGTQEKGFGGIRYGARLSPDTSFRIFAKDFDRGGSVYTSGEHAPDKLREGRAGFRIDSDVSSRDELTLHGDIFTGKADNEFNTNRIQSLQPDLSDTTRLSGGYAMASWKRAFSSLSDMRLQFYYDQKQREDVTFGEKVDTFDIDFQHRLPLGLRQDVIWGFGYRISQDRTKGSSIISLDPPSATTHIASAFIQDDITLKEDRLHFVAGTRIENNDYTGIEVQPNVRLLWTPDKADTLWVAVSRAVHTPNRLESDVVINAVAPFPGPFPTVISATGNPEAKSESVVAYELGYRVRPVERVYFDTVAFFNVYKNLLASGGGTPDFAASPPPPHLVIPTVLNNAMDSKTYGAEMAAHWSVTDWWRLEATYAYLRILLNADPSRTFATTEDQEGNSPRNQASLRSSMDIFKTIESDLWFRYVDSLPVAHIKSYVTLDARLGWKPVNNLELSVVGQNLLEKRHQESATAPLLFVERSVYGKVAWEF